ncbi:hypothetical protein HDU99_010157 [Rhizoclosmatium hyalinum]|nr:hypothetical protein HDU99_010157 [Rhizoclosmatium hyalinum]
MFLEIQQRDPSIVAVKPTILTTLAAGAIRVRIDKFGLSANNITYVGLGESMSYSKFFPTTTDGSMKLPVWGLATVMDSNHPDIQKGVRFYGYFPAATHCDLVPSRVTKKSFYVDRTQVPADRYVYNTYEFCASDPLYSHQTENAMILFRPLWFTSYYLYDYVKYNNFFGAGTVVLTSASSKTSFCFAQLCQSASIPVIGVTAAKNLEFTKSLGIYTSVVTYEDLLPLKNISSKTLFVDVTGSPSLYSKIVAGLPSRPVNEICVGFAHATSSTVEGNLFFAPSWIKKRFAEVGVREAMKDVDKGWKLLMSKAESWIQFREFNGVEAVKRSYVDAAEGRIRADIGYICTMHEIPAKL